MWPDNETDVDLLGFDILVDELVVALTDPRLLPLTVGVLGGWGSGKSSLLKQAFQELDADDGQSRCVCVEFSPWKYEDYEDVKAALAKSVLDACESHVADDKTRTEEIGRLRGFAARFARRSRAAGRLAISAAPIVAPAAFVAIDPSAADTTLAMAAGLANLGAPLVRSALDESAEPVDDGPGPVVDIADFHRRYAAMVDALPEIDGVLVFIDDLDRCLPETIVDTFEAIRLFLNAPKTAYVIAANRQIIEAAIDSRYRQLHMDDGRRVGHEYLEKMLQLQVTVPALSAVETATYVSLLVTELHLAKDDFADIRAAVRQRRAASPFAAVYNGTSAHEVLDSRLTNELASDLRWAEDISPALADGFDGNPRSIKRFLNDLRWRQRAAKRRDVELSADVLAKLMVLEERHAQDLQTIFDWQQGAEGPSDELARAQELARPWSSERPAEEAEAAVESPDSSRTGVRTGKKASPRVSTLPGTASSGKGDPVESWAARPEISRWLQLAPDLSAVDLRPYFTYFREHIVIGSPASALRPELQGLLAKLKSDAPAVARSALDEFAGMTPSDQDDVALALLSDVARHPASASFGTVAEIAGRTQRLTQTVVGSLLRIPHSALDPMRLPGAIRHLPESAERSQLLGAWTSSSVDAVRLAATAASRPRAQGR